MKYAGLDVHKRVIEAVVLDHSGAVLHRERFDATREALISFGEKQLGADTSVALEATTNTWSVVDILAPFAAEVVISNPMQTKAIAWAKVKTDKVDALVLAQLLRCDFLPRVWRPDKETQQQRMLATHRAGLVQQRTRLKNQIHAVLHQRLIHPTVKMLFGKEGLVWLEKLDLDPVGRHTLDCELRQLQFIEEEIKTTMSFLAKAAWGNERVKLLMTLPGVDVTVAQAIVALLGDISRFPDGNKAASYLGLVPSVKQSAEKCYHGHITKQGKSHARWLLVQAAQHLGRHPGPLGVFFRRVQSKRKHGRNIAVVATARKLVTIAYLMLKNNEPYRYAIPRTTDTKLARLRIQGGGKRKSPSSRKGKPRSPTHGTGVQYRTTPALAKVYEAEGLPPTAPLKDAEQRMLKTHGVSDFAEKIAQDQKVPRKVSTRATQARSTSVSEVEGS